MYSRTAIAEALQMDIPEDFPYLTSDMDVATARKHALKASLLKKYLDGNEEQENCDRSALAKFLACNERCKSFVLKPRDMLDSLIIGHVKSDLHDFIGNGTGSMLNVWSFSEHLAVGPGANVNSQSYNFYSKLYDSSLSTTNDHLVRLYRTITSRSPMLDRAERFRFERHGLSLVNGSYLSFVPKTSLISRTICTEPTLNMLFQRGISFHLDRYNLRKFNISLDTQPLVNRRLAKAGSISGKFGTIDLESASDSISRSLCAEILPGNLLSWLNLTRSPSTTLPSGACVELDMISSMGNGYTFSLQTMIFATIVTACYRLMDIVPTDGRNGPRNFSVFGDDIIVLKETYDLVQRALELFGFIVNRSKSYNSGNFRESCGEDYYHGRNIRGVYLQSIKTKGDAYSALNRVVRWCARTGIMLRNLVSLLRQKISYLPVPFSAGDTEGLKVPLELARPKLRWSKRYQCHKYIALQPVAFEVELPLSEADNDFGYIQKMVYRKPKKACKPFGYNPDGLLHAFIGGYIRNGRILLRSNEQNRSRRTTRFSSSWDDLSSSQRLFGVDQGDWEFACLELLSL